ncbi:MAG: hypothetical protein KDB69_01155 [Acidimicrobiia bacterium]|nr:hypothetical protein [Acidimicrobiia bacterium]
MAGKFDELLTSPYDDLGLRVPTRVGIQEDDLIEYYVSSVEAGRCLTSAGYEVGEPPTQEEWLSQPLDTRWDPWRVLMIQFLDPSDFESAVELCQT